ncbi:MAG: SpoIIE family protein phosphatase [Acidobacteriota bacterium]
MLAHARLLIRRPDGTTSLHPLPSTAARVGRALDNDLSFPEEPDLSRRHLSLERTGAGWLVRDLGSRNGTLLNGVPVQGAVELRPGDRIQAGRIVFELQLPEPPEALPSHPLSREGAPGTATIAVRLAHLMPPTAEQRAAPAEPPLKSASHLQALLHAGVELAGTMSLADLLPLILDLAANAVGASRGVLLLEEDGQLVPRAVRGKPFQISRTAQERVLRGKESLLIQDASSDEKLRMQASIISQGVRSLMAVPLQTKELVIGLLYLDSASAARAFTREDLNLITVMANIAAVRIEIARLAEVEERERRVSLEMEQAAEIQRGLLPACPPGVKGLEIAAFNQSCYFAGGDYFDFFERPDGRLLIVVGDVAGKGMPAALLMASVQARMQVLVEIEHDLARLAEILNRITAAHCPGNRFVTLFLCEIDPSSGEICYVNAGHNPPFVLRRNGEAETLAGGGLILGVLRTAPYQAMQSRLDEGDMLVLFSDGVTEAENSATGEQFGEERLIESLAAASAAAPEEMIGRVRAAVSAFAGSVSGSDDFTLVMVKKRPVA